MRRGGWGRGGGVGRLLIDLVSVRAGQLRSCGVGNGAPAAPGAPQDVSLVGRLTPRGLHIALVAAGIRGAVWSDPSEEQATTLLSYRQQYPTPTTAKVSYAKGIKGGNRFEY